MAPVIGGRLAGVAVAAVLGAGALSAVPPTAAAAAPDPGGLIGGILGPSGGQQSHHRSRASLGRTGARDRRLRPSCHNYRYHYVVHPPTGDWALETFLRDPRGRGLASGGIDSDADPRRGHDHFRFCRDSTRPGRFTIRALLHWWSSGGEEHRRWLRPSHFHLHR